MPSAPGASVSPGDFSLFSIPDKLTDRLRNKGISELYPVQYKTFDVIQSGNDVVVLARTGTGKTLAFSLPIVKSLITLKDSGSAHGKSPSVLILAPTRELVLQIATDLQSICATDLKVLPVYGGVPISSQIHPLRSGVDIIVGTPGRIIDLMDRNALKLNTAKYVVLDEVDRMLDMGFSKDVERILSEMYTTDESTEKPQTLLFSATMPSWVASVAGSYLSPDAVHISLLEDSENKTSQNVTHLALSCSYPERASVMADVIRVYSKRRESRSIIFCERKKDADELAAHASMSSDCHVLHGDVPQDKRELVLQKFREGKYRTLVTTNVAARGLDVPDIDLVVQCHPPKDVEDYIHRSGRTGRADRSGTSIVFYTPRERYLLSHIENAAGISFERIAPPSLQDIVDSWGGDEMMNVFMSVPKATWSAFLPFAQSMVQKFASVSVGHPVLTNQQSDADLSTAGSEINKKKKKKKKDNSLDCIELQDSTADSYVSNEVPLKPRVQRDILLQLLCCALARLSGKDGAVEDRSLLSARKGYTTYRLDVVGAVYRKGLAYAILRQQLPEDVVEAVSNLNFIRGKTGFVFDLPSTSAEAVTTHWSDDPSRAQLSVVTELPELDDAEADDGNQTGRQNGHQWRSGNTSRSWRGGRQSFGRGRGGFGNFAATKRQSSSPGRGFGAKRARGGSYQRFDS